MTAKLSGLNSPLVIRGKMLKSRFMYPIAQVHFLQGPELYPADPTVTFYEKIAKNGCALVLTQDTTNPDQRKMPENRPSGPAAVLRRLWKLRRLRQLWRLWL